MSSAQVQLARQQQNILDAVAALREADLPTPRSDEVEMEPMVSDTQRLAAALGDVGEHIGRQETAIGHLADHIAADLTKRVEKLEQPEKAQPKGAKKK
jgi:hypothetical protein